MENKNLVVALVLMLVVWVGFTVLFPPANPERETPAPAVQGTASQTEKAPLPEEGKLPPSEGATAPVALPAPAVKERELIVDTDNYRAVFTNSGARLKSFELKNYTVTTAPESPKVFLIDVEQDRLGTLRTTGSESFGIPADLPYRISVVEPEVRVTDGNSREIVFSAVSGAVEIQKIFSFHGDRYDFDLEIRLINRGSETSKGNLELALVNTWEESMAGSRFEFVGPTSLVEKKVHKDQVKDLEKAPVTYGDKTVWTAFENKYFMSAVVPLEGDGEKLHLQKSGDVVENVLDTPFQTLGGGQSVSYKYLLYFGPRELDILKKVNYQLAEAINFGFFSPIARPLLHVLKFFHSFVGNYGVAIILLTVIIKILFWPLTQKSYSSMKAMQKLQPEMQKIREKFKNDRERLNREIMELYKKNRVNPLGGCLPMVVQIPVFFALYRVLLDSIELRHAPFIFWLTDLSSKDPYYVTPLIMGATMFIQQRMTPSTMDPTQAKLFMLMPVVFTFLFLNFPSGLVIYWLVNNLLTIVQQYYINKKA